MLTHKEMVEKMLENPEVKAEYEAVADEFSLFDELINTRIQAGLTQSDVASIMGTKTPAVARLESGGGSNKHSPSLKTLRKYAGAVGCHLEIKLVPKSSITRHSS